MLVEYHSNHWMLILFKGADVCTHDLKALTMEGFERMFNRGGVGYADTAIATEAVDHQEPLGASFPPHLKNVVTTLRTGFPDLHFEVHHMIAEGDTVACRSTMTGTRLGAARHRPARGHGAAGRDGPGVAHAHVPLQRRPAVRPLAPVGHD